MEEAGKACVMQDENYVEAGDHGSKSWSRSKGETGKRRIVLWKAAVTVHSTPVEEKLRRGFLFSASAQKTLEGVANTIMVKVCGGAGRRGCYVWREGWRRVAVREGKSVAQSGGFHFSHGVKTRQSSQVNTSIKSTL